MKIEVTKEALDWFKRDVRLESGDKVRFYTKIYGSSPIREGYALAFTVDYDTKDAAAQTEVEGITFYVDERDVWFFDGYDLHVTYNEKLDEVAYEYKENK